MNFTFDEYGNCSCSLEDYVHKTMVGNVSNSKNSYMIEKVIQNDIATIVFWSDRTKTVVKIKDTDENDVYAAVAQALAKKIYGSTGGFHKLVDDHLVIQMPPKNGLQINALNGFSKFFEAIWKASHPSYFFQI